VTRYRKSLRSFNAKCKTPDPFTPHVHLIGTVLQRHVVHADVPFYTDEKRPMVIGSNVPPGSQRNALDILTTMGVSVTIIAARPSGTELAERKCRGNNAKVRPRASNANKTELLNASRHPDQALQRHERKVREARKG